MGADREAAPTTLVDLLPRFAQARLWVVGDLMLDEYLEGDVQRISPEAPVPVLCVQAESDRLGGAANVAHNARALGATVDLCGVVGTDAAGDRLLACCAAAGIATTAIGRVAGQPTTRKVRALARNQQLLRLDFETGNPVDAELARGLFAGLAAGPRPDAVVISDYAKGMASAALVGDVIGFAARAGVPVLVDPKATNLAHYRGATVLKPNLAELERSIGHRLPPGDTVALDEATQALLTCAAARALVVTLGADGLAVARPGTALEVLPAARREVYDVTGAGDTVLAVLALALAVGAEIATAARIANAAGGIVVGRVGTAVVRPHELATALGPGSGEKTLTMDEAVRRRQWWLAQKRRVVFTNGCFDLLHVGHLALLRHAASLGDVLLVAINSDDSVRRLKGAGRPVVPEEGRARLVAALECVDAVVCFEEDTPLEVLERLRPDVLVKGADYGLDEVVGRALVESYGGRVVLVPLVPDHSTSTLVSRIRESR
ncbi:MAG: D-glycero-beta-D-manno-heptose 1-phosphate adenylyltransferase [Deltaproteobacteria bacterium]|nr:D-glycero-beta-D-manno-heptose 1-phosphate adenylyltransferase [Deltaproteobacteria bacterium]